MVNMSKYWRIFAGIVVSLIVLGAFITQIVTTKDEITPNDEFFVLNITNIPDINGSLWELRIDGLVQTPVNLTYEDILSMPMVNVTATLECVEGPSGRAVWGGVQLKYVLDFVGLKPEAKEVVFHAEDGFSSSLTLEDAQKDDVLLAYEMNGETLPRNHGFPLRLAVPGKYGYKWVKWITHIEVVDYDYKGFWEERGWDDDADVSTFTYWGVHSALLSIAAIFGALATISGLKFSKHSTFWKRLPDYYTKEFHKNISTIYLAILFPVFIFWALTTYSTRGNVFYSNHGILALMVVILHVVGLITGIGLLKKKKGMSTLHLVANLLGYLLLLGTIITGLLLVLR